MFFKRIEFHNYLPFTHCGNTKVSVDFTAPCTAIMGGNGSGKSSMLRAMTPLPAVRTDYGPKGKIVKVLSHNGSIYELISDFSNSAAPHSFIKDGVQLNVGGTTETQRDLVEEHFGYSKLIAEIMSGNMKFCDMTPAARKQLFSATYPSDLSFVLEYHKKICANIRACGNQLKLLRGREASLKSLLIDDVERERLERFKRAATNIVDGIDKTILLLDNEIKNYKVASNFLEQCHFKYDGWEPLDIRDEILHLKYEILKGFRETGIRSKLKDTFMSDSIRIAASKHHVTANVTRDRITAATIRVEEIRDELNKFLACKEAAATASEKSTLEERLRNCVNECNDITLKIGSDSSIGLVDRDKIDVIETRFLPYIKNWITNFHNSDIKVKSLKEVTDLGVRLEHASAVAIPDLRNEIVNVTTELNTIKAKLDKLRARSYPKDCTEICPLRDAVSETLESTEKRFNELLSKKRELIKHGEELKTFITDNCSIYQEQSKVHRDIEKLLHPIRSLGLEFVAFNNEDPIDFLNNHAFDIANRIAKACEITRLWQRKAELCSEIEVIQTTLNELANTKQLQISAELIDQTIADREDKLNQGIAELESLEKFASNEEAKGNALDKLGKQFSDLEYRVEDASNMMNHWRVEDIIKFNSKLIEDLANAKHDINDELYNVSKILSDQQKHLDILKDEILPTINKVEKEKKTYEMVADGLSPASGLPCIYLIRFINRLLRRANDIIHDVWLYDMDLVYLKEDEELDFMIPVLFRNSTKTKDISLCSEGQKAIVNFALNVAICIERGYFDKYPFSFDENDANLTESHRTRLTSLLSELLDNNVLKQMFLVNHFAVQSGLSQCECVVLHPDGIVLPALYNEHADIE